MVSFVFSIKQLGLEGEVVAPEHQCGACEEEGMPYVAERSLHKYGSDILRTGNLDFCPAKIHKT